MPGADSSACPGCKVVLPGFIGPTHEYMEASPACWDMFSRVLAREYSDPQYGAAHRLTVDSYAAQHPGKQERRAIQSVNLHLVSLHLMLDRLLAGEFATRVLGLMTQRLKEEFVWLAPPASLGDLTVADVAKANSAEDHIGKVTAWANSVWRAWQPHHPAITKLADRALSLTEGESR